MTDAPPLSPIRTRRLDLHVVRPQDYALLETDRSHPALWADRGFSNPHGYLVDDPGPLPFRLPQVREDPLAAPYLLRVAVLRDAGIIIGGAGFHARPDAVGMVEIGFTVVPPWRRQGLGTEILHGMWGWVLDQPGVRVLRYSVGVENAISQRIVRGLGFTHIGVQQDDVDGPEDVFEMSAAEYRARFRD